LLIGYPVRLDVPRGAKGILAGTPPSPTARSILVKLPDTDKELIHARREYFYPGIHQNSLLQYSNLYLLLVFREHFTLKSFLFSPSLPLQSPFASTSLNARLF
jgi:hypothetical protein